MGYKDFIDRHMTWLADDDADTPNATLYTSAGAVDQTFTWVWDENHRDSPADVDGAGVREESGQLTFGFVDPAEVTLTVARIVVIESSWWRVTKVDPQRGRAGSQWSVNVELEALEAEPDWSGIDGVA